MALKLVEHSAELDLKLLVTWSVLVLVMRKAFDLAKVKAS
jgi:hypothetical protein